MQIQILTRFSGIQNSDEVEICGAVRMYLLDGEIIMGEAVFRVEASLDPTTDTGNPIQWLEICRGSEIVLTSRGAPLESLSSMDPRDLFAFNLFLGLLTLHVTQGEDYQISSTFEIADLTPPPVDRYLLDLLRGRQLSS